MTFGKKVREARKQNGLTQEELAKKLCVSRSAITKWESDRGMPDIENLKMISRLFDVSIDYLVGDSDMEVGKILKEPINIDSYPKGKARGLKEDFLVLGHYPDAEKIWHLLRERRLSTKEKIADFLLPGVQHMSDQWCDPSVYYLVEQNNTQFLVNVTEDFIVSQRLMGNITDKSFQIGEQIFTKTRRKIKNK